jgi:hypothetical protein
MKNRSFLFFRKFHWNTPDGMVFPKEGRVYLSDSEGDRHIVPFEDSTGLFLEKESMNGEFETWSCEVEEITLDNLLDLPITANDIKMMAATENIMDGMLDHEENHERRILDEMGSSLFLLKDDDPDAYEAFLKIITLLSDSYSSRAYIALTDDLMWNPVTARLSNITLASYQLESYLNEKDPTKIGDLLNSIYTLFTEVVRKHKELKQNL